MPEAEEHVGEAQHGFTPIAQYVYADSHRCPDFIVVVNSLSSVVMVGDRIEEAKGIGSVMTDSSPTHTYLSYNEKLKGIVGLS